MHVESDWQRTLSDAGFGDAWAFWQDARVVAWRRLPERENATLDLPGVGRLHVKRFRGRGFARREVGGIRLLESAGIASTPVVAWDESPRGGLLVTADLTGLTPADRLIAEGVPFADLLEPTADVAARLHSAGLHHRDLYPCHFLLRPDGTGCRLIDAGRVRRLPRLFRRRWVVKDVAQSAYGLGQAGVAGDSADAWLRRWADGSGHGLGRLMPQITRKVAAIARSDRRASARSRDVTLPPPPVDAA